MYFRRILSAVTSVIVFTNFTTNSNAVSVRIGEIKNVQLGSFCKVPIYINSSSLLVERVDLQVSYDTQFISHPQILPSLSHFSDSVCNWKSISSSVHQDTSTGSGIFRISAEADLDKVLSLDCFRFNPDSPAFVIRFLVTNNYTFEGHDSPINFIWFKCSDNSIDLVSHDEENEVSTVLAVAGSVFTGETIETAVDTFPTTKGLPPTCPTVSSSKSHSKIINFYHGGVSSYRWWIVDDFGDVNLNGLSNEVADFLLFQDYFLYGLPVFTINPAGQIANTDVNGDGKTVTISDLVHLDAIIRGDAKPLRKPFPIASGSVSMDKSANQVYFKSDSTAYAVWLQFRGSITPISKINAQLFRYIDADSVTNVLIFGLDSAYTSEIELMRCTYGCTLLDAQAATRDGTQFDLTIEN